MAVVGILAVHLTGTCRQQVLQGPKTVLDPVVPLPGPDELRPADSSVETHHVALLLPGLLNHDEGHGGIRRTGGPQPRIAHPLIAKSTGTTSLPSPMTTTSRTPSIPESTRCPWPLNQVPTRSNCSPYFIEC